MTAKRSPFLRMNSVSKPSRDGALRGVARRQAHGLALLVGVGQLGRPVGRRARFAQLLGA